LDDELHDAAGPFRRWVLEQPDLHAVGLAPMTGLTRHELGPHGSTADGRRPMSTWTPDRLAVAYDERLLAWRLGDGHPTDPVRATLCVEALQRAGVPLDVEPITVSRAPRSRGSPAFAATDTLPAVRAHHPSDSIAADIIDAVAL